MRLQYALTLNDPKSLDIGSIQFGGSGAGLTKMDVLTALGYLQKRERTGLALMYAKFTKDSGEFKRATNAAAKYGALLALKLPGRSDGRSDAVIGQALARLAVLEYCRTPDSPGAMCRCGGSGRVADEAKISASLTRSKASPDDLSKPCSRCKGTGMRPVPSLRVYRAVKAISPDLAERTFTRRWKGLYVDILNWCHEQEDRAEQGYRLLMRDEAA